MSIEMNYNSQPAVTLTPQQGHTHTNTHGYRPPVKAARPFVFSCRRPPN